MKKQILLALILCSVLPLGYWALRWKNPDINKQPTCTTHDCIYKNTYQHAELNGFSVDYLVAPSSKST